MNARCQLATIELAKLQQCTGMPVMWTVQHVTFWKLHGAHNGDSILILLAVELSASLRFAWHIIYKQFVTITTPNSAYMTCLLNNIPKVCAWAQTRPPVNTSMDFWLHVTFPSQVLHIRPSSHRSLILFIKQFYGTCQCCKHSQQARRPFSINTLSTLHLSTI